MPSLRRFSSPIFAVATLLLLASPARASGPVDGVWVPIPGPPAFSHSGFYDPVRDRLLLYVSGSVWECPRSAPRWSRFGPPGPFAGSPATVYDPLRDRLLACVTTASGLEVWALSLGASPHWTQIASGGPSVTIETSQAALYDSVADHLLVVGITSTPACCEHGPDYTHHVWSFDLGGSSTWAEITPAGQPTGMDVTSMAVVLDDARHRLLFLGGTNWVLDPATHFRLDYYRAGVYALSLDAPAWSTIVGSPPNGPERAGAGVIYDPGMDRLVEAGGRNTSGYASDTWSVNLSGAPAWSQLLGPVASAVRNNGLMVYDPVAHRALFHGGQSPVYNLRNDLVALALTGAPAWSGVLPGVAGPPGRIQSAAIDDASRHRVVMYGGVGADGNALADLWSLPLGVAPQWIPLAAAGSPPARTGHSAVYDPGGDRMLVFGGSSLNSRTGASNELWELSLGSSPTWTLLAPSGTPPAPRWFHSAILDPVRHRMIVYGGQNASGAPLGDVWSLALDGPPVWTPIAAGGAGQSRYQHAAIYDPGRDAMIVYGGFSPDQSVLALSLAGSPQWSTIAAGGTPPPAQTGQTAVLDPVLHRLIVNGGGGASVNRTFALALQGAPMWSELAPDGPPDPRYAHVAVYDDAAGMVVFSGGPYWVDDTWALEWPDAPTAVLVSLVSAAVEPDRVRIEWQLSDASALVSAERRSSGSAWAALSGVTVEPQGRVVVEDHDVLAGGSYEYRLAVRGGGGVVYAGQVPVQVPAGMALDIELERNPSESALELALWVTQPVRGRARVDLLDASGRRLVEPLVADLGPGRHRVVLGIGGLRPGLYFARVRAAGGERTRRAVLAR